MTARRTAVATLLASLLAACTSAPPRAAAPAAVPAQPRHTLAEAGTTTQADAILASASGSLVSGRVSLRAVPGGVQVSGVVGGLVRNGAHGLQVHARGDCSAVDARSAGAFYDPRTGPVQSGAVVEPGRIVADADGVARVDLHIPGAVLGGGAGNDILGRSLLVLGATPGAISARVACGVIRPAPASGVE